MKLDDLLATMTSADLAGRSDFNVPLLQRRVETGRRVASATLLRPGLGDAEPCIVVRLVAPPGQSAEDELVPVGLGPRGRSLLATVLGQVDVLVEAPERPSDAPSMRSELADLIRRTVALEADERASRLMDWIMERIDASRCALVPVEGGALGPPLAFHLRGAGHRMEDPRHLPRQVIDEVLRTRHPVVSHDVGGEADVLAPRGTLVRQRIRGYMAAPVVFRGDLLAVAYVDRLDRARRFSLEEQATFQAFGYELARPLLELRAQRARRDYEALRDELLASERSEVVPPSPALAVVLARADALAHHVSENLLLLGETGVGKEWVARRIHALSGRSGAFVPVNVNALPTELFEAELFGSVRGAFTGATDRKGRIAEAEGGTLFLDEIGDLELGQQVKLLRFLQDRLVRPVGGRDERIADVRIVAATNRDVASATRDGSFRLDLLHRFAPPLEVPPLRERREELLPLATTWLAARARAAGMPGATLSEGARRFLMEQEWPGNVRQLQAVLSHALLQSGGAVDEATVRSLVEAVPPSPATAPRGSWAELRASLDAEERAWLVRALADSDGNVEAAARAAGCPRTTFRNALKRHGIGP